MYSNTIEIRKISIVDLYTDAIVNAANEALAAGGGVCGAIFKAAGYKEFQQACDKYGHCNTGDAVITPGFSLKAKHVIHAVGPRYSDGRHGEPELLKSAYKSALELAVTNGCHSIGFPLISAGIFGYPLIDAWNIALDACSSFLKNLKDYQLNIIFAVLSDEIIKAGKECLKEGKASVFKRAERSDWKTTSMPKRNSVFTLERTFTKEQMSSLRKGHIPEEMEDKWFWYMDGSSLYAHRSWSGFCIYKIDFKDNGHHVVTVNRDEEQYGCKSDEEDLERVNDLLDRWTKPTYDHYGQWLSETAEALKNA